MSGLVLDPELGMPFSFASAGGVEDTAHIIRREKSRHLRCSPTPSSRQQVTHTTLLYTYTYTPAVVRRSQCHRYNTSIILPTSTFAVSSSVIKLHLSPIIHIKMPSSVSDSQDFHDSTPPQLSFPASYDYDSDPVAAMTSYSKVMHQHTKRQMEAATQSVRRRSSGSEQRTLPSLPGSEAVNKQSSISSMDELARVYVMRCRLSSGAAL